MGVVFRIMKFFSYIYGTISDRANYAWDGSINVPVHYRRVSTNYRTTYLRELRSNAKDRVPKDRVLLLLLLCQGQRKVAKSRL